MLGTITGRILSGNPTGCDPDWVLAEERLSSDDEPLTGDICKLLCYSEMDTREFRLDMDIDGYDKCYCDVNKC